MSEDSPKTTAPRIGDFRPQPPGNAPRVSTTTLPLIEQIVEKNPAPPATGAAEGADASKKDEPEVKLTPRQAYEKRLKEYEIAPSEAHAIYDAVMDKGFYEERIKLGGTRTCVFRTRLYDDHQRLQDTLELARPQLVMTQEDIVTRYNLAASLHEWQGKIHVHATDAEFDAMMTLIKKLPGPVFSLLSQKLSEFDRKILVVFSDGATDSFS